LFSPFGLLHYTNPIFEFPLFASNFISTVQDPLFLVLSAKKPGRFLVSLTTKFAFLLQCFLIEVCLYFILLFLVVLVIAEGEERPYFCVFHVWSRFVLFKQWNNDWLRLKFSQFNIVYNFYNQSRIFSCYFCWWPFFCGIPGTYSSFFCNQVDVNILLVLSSFSYIFLHQDSGLTWGVDLRRSTFINFDAKYNELHSSQFLGVLIM
jgi:hypothetical protein